MRKTLFVIVVGLLLMAGLNVHAQSYATLWKQVEQAQKRDLPQSVVQWTGKIVQKAERERNVPQLLKATLCRNAYTERLSPDSLYLHLQQWEEWLVTEQHPVHRAVLHSLLAEAYESARSHSQGGVTELEEMTKDVRQWTPALFNRRIGEHLTASLQAEERLLATRTDSYLPLVERGAESRYYAHDLYHLLARRAAECYGRMRGAGGEARADSLYRHVAALYAQRPDCEDAALLAALDGWQWRNRRNTYRPVPHGDVDGRAAADELAFLDSLIVRYGHRELCAEVWLVKAERMSQETVENGNKEALQQKNRALALCDEALRRYPRYGRVGALRNLRARLLQPQLTMNVPQCAYPGDSLKISTQVANLEGFTLNLYRTDYRELPLGDGGELMEPNRLKRGAPVSTSHYAVQSPDGTEAYPLAVEQRMDYAFLLPDEVGLYVLEAVPDRPARQGKRVYAAVAVSRLKLLSLPLTDNRVEVAVVDGRSGHPVAQAEVAFYQRYGAGNVPPQAVGHTAADGRLIQRLPQQNAWAKVRTDDDTFLPMQSLGVVPYGETGNEKAQTRVALLTDRSVYRPGQSLMVKGVVYEQQRWQARVLPGRPYTLRLLDANRQEVASQAVTTGEFGSFSHTFVLPSSCLNGQFSVEVKEVPSTTTIRVEEYKRPTFELTLNPLKSAYRLGDTVRMQGNATAFNGTSVQDAKVIGRLTRLPSWGRGFGRTATALRCDTVSVDAEGRFVFTLPLEPPAGESDGLAQASFCNYQVEATVVDEAGESHTVARRFTAYPKAYAISVPHLGLLYKEKDLDSLLIQVTNHEGVSQYPSARYRLYGKEAPRTLLREAAFVPNVPLDGTAWRTLPSGAYRLVVEVNDSLGRREQSEELEFTLMSCHDVRPATFTPLFFHEEELEFDADHPARFDIGTSMQDVYLLWTEVDVNGRVRQHSCYLSDTLIHYTVPYREVYGDGTTWTFALVKENKLYTRSFRLTKRQPDTHLEWKWEVFRDCLTPGGEEEWRLVFTDPQGVAASAELLATMYDASLDRIYRRSQRLRLFFRTYFKNYVWRGDGVRSRFIGLDFTYPVWKVSQPQYDRFVSFDASVRDLIYAEGMVMADGDRSFRLNQTMTKQMSVADVPLHADVAEAEEENDVMDEGDATMASDASVRTNLAETAFFYPHLLTDSLGRVAFRFQVPQSLTRWNFRGYAHTRTMQTANLEATIQTAKLWMVTPHLPRFVRVGDRTRLSATVANQTGKAQQGVVTLTLFDPVREKSLQTKRVKFTCEAGGKAVVHFDVEADGRYDLLGVRLVADGRGFSDGEQHLLPILSDSQWITETLPLPIRGGEKRTFALDSLFNHHSPTATGRQLTVEFTGAPAWLAVQALPSLVAPADGADAMTWAAAYYAAILSSHIATSQPAIRRVWEAWRMDGEQGETFASRLRQNQQLKEIALDESPWILEERGERERRAHVASLLDVNLVSAHSRQALEKLAALQLADGSWSWYPGMQGSAYVTTYVIEQLLRLPLLTGSPLAGTALQMERKAMEYLRREVAGLCRSMRRQSVRPKELPYLAQAYLYLTALQGGEVPAEARADHRYLFDLVPGQIATPSMRLKAESAFILWRAGRRDAASGFLASLREHLVREEEVGAHFAFNDTPYTWGMMPIPTHVRAMEALRLTGTDEALLEEMRLWLLKQKQTRAWHTPAATADAIYALLCGGSELLSSEGDVLLTVGKERLRTTDSQTPGLNYIQATYGEESTACKARQIEVEKSDSGSAWGAVYAQYRSPLSDIKAQGGAALAVEKQLCVERMDAQGVPSLHLLADGERLQAGDKVVVRLVLRLDRAMDFLQLKDGRAACLEPIGSLSGYRRARGFGYYVDKKDASTRFFFDHLGKGVHVLEYAARVVRAGRYQAGMATLQCAYAPEFAAHSSAPVVEVK